MSEQPSTDRVAVKPCPHCGGTDTACAIVDEDSGRYWVECVCGARGPVTEALKDARPAWNRRLAPEPVAKPDAWMLISKDGKDLFHTDDCARRWAKTLNGTLYPLFAGQVEIRPAREDEASPPTKEAKP